MKFSKLYLAKEAIKNPGMIKKIPDMYRMVKLWVKGTYKTNSTDIIFPLLGLLYVISPLDLIPETIPFIGVLDDMAILALVLPKLLKEVDKFREWEARNSHSSKTIDAEVVD